MEVRMKLKERDKGLSLYKNKLNSKQQKESRSMGIQKQVNRCNKTLLTEEEEETETLLPTEKQTERSTEEQKDRRRS